LTGIHLGDYYSVLRYKYWKKESYPLGLRTGFV
jgi:hypothetical protein